MFLENLKEAITSIFSNKMRSILTMLGIIIGISSVITITTIGSSIQSTIRSTMNSLGGNSVQIYLEANYPETDEEWDTWVYPEMTQDDYMTDEMLESLQETFPDQITGIMNTQDLGYGKIATSADHYANVSVMGTSKEVLTYNKIRTVYGRSLSDEDNLQKKRVCMIADTMADFYFGYEDPIGQIISFENASGPSCDLVVVGIYHYEQALFGPVDTSVPEKDRSTYVFVPLKTVMEIAKSEVTGYSDVNIMLTPSADSKVVSQQILDFLAPYYENNKNFHVAYYNMSESLKVVDVVINVVTIAISFIAAISLVVGGVGVMNIMLVSITERTREIGVRMAMGAKRKTIRTQFVIEAIVLCLIGGAIGILIGVTFGFAIGAIAKVVINNVYADYAAFIILSVKPSFTAIILSLFFSMLTGVFFGYYPANKASKMEVIDALRYE